MPEKGTKRRILIVSHVFPPIGGIPVQRALSFAKYLPDLGYDVHVLTAWNPGAPVHDPGLLRHVPKSVKVHRCFSAEVPFALRHRVWSLFSGGKSGAKAPAAAASGQRPAAPSRSVKSVIANFIRQVSCPDPEVLWVPFAIRAAARIIRKYKIDTVLVTAPPFSIFLTGNALKRRFPNLTLVTDFRDEWLKFYLQASDFSGDYIRRRATSIERATIELSDVVVATTDTILSEIRTRYPDQPGEKFAIVMNGYDPEAFAAFRPRPHTPGKIVVVLTGTVARSTSARYYLDVLDSLPEALRNRFETRFVGRVADDEKQYFNGRKSNIKLLGFLPQAQALEQMEDADYLLLTLTDASHLPGKLFEYLATEKPILAVTLGDSEIARLLAETGAGLHADPSDPDAVRRMILAAVDRLDNGAGIRPDLDAIRRYQRPRLAAELAGLIDLAAARRTSSMASVSTAGGCGATVV